MANITSTSNKDIDYIVKDFSSAEDAMITFANTQFGPGTSANRLWSDFNLDSFSRNWLDIVAYIADVFFFYLDNQATQSYLQTATVPSAIANISKQFGFTPATASSSSGTVSVTFNAAGTLPLHTKLQSTSGLPFFTTSELVVSAGSYPTTASVGVLQGQLNTNTFTSKGVQNEEFNLTVANVIVDLTNVYTAEYSPQVTVNGTKYTLVTTFINSSGADTDAVVDSSGNVIGGGGRVYQLNQRANGTYYIQFGDGTFGRQLPPNATVQVIYRTGGGTAGNIAAKTLTTLSGNYTFVTSITNPEAMSGGADAQTTSQLQQLIPASLRTLERAVSEQDYSEILTLNFPQVLYAETETNNYDPGVDLNIYVVPNATTVTQISANPTLQTTLSKFLNLRKMVTVQFRIMDAYAIPVLISLEVHLASTTNQSITSAAIQTALQNYFNLQTGGESGTGIGFATPILIEDISAILKTITGIDRFEFRKFTYRPRIAQNVIGLTTTYINSDVEVFKNVTESEWLAAAAGTVSEAAGTLLVNNSSSAGFTYDSSTGQVTYTSVLLPETLTAVSPGDLFRDGSALPGLNEKVNIQTVAASSGGVAEVTHVTTIADVQGLKEITEILTVPNSSQSLEGRYFLLYDSAGSVGVYFKYSTNSDQPPAGAADRFISVPINTNDTDVQIASYIVTALTSDGAFTATAVHNAVSVTLNTTKAVSASKDGIIPTGFTFIRFQASVSPATLYQTYFTVYDATGAVQVWYDTGAGVPPSGITRGCKVSIAPNATATAVAAATVTALNAFNSTNSFSATSSTNVVTITDKSIGVRTDASDGPSPYPTSFTISTVTQGQAPTTLGGKYFDLYDQTYYSGVTNPTNLVRVWFNTGSSTAPTVTPTNGERLLPVSILTSDSAAQVATKLKTALAADSQFTNSSVTSNTVTAVNTYTGAITGTPNAGTSTFTVTVLQAGTTTSDHIILGVDSANNKLYLATGQVFPGTPSGSVYTVSGTPGGAGSIRTGSSSYESFKVFKKINAVAASLSVNSITDTNLDLSVVKGTAATLGAHLLVDNSQALLPGVYATGDYYLEDSSGNIWEIVANDSDTITTGNNAVNDSAITSVSAGDYKVVQKLTEYQILFNGNIFTINYNDHNTIYSIGAQFSNIGTIGNAFQINKTQTNLGSLGTAVDLIKYDATTGIIELGGQPDLSYINSQDFLIDSTGQTFRLTAIDNRSQPSIGYDSTHFNTSTILQGTGSNTQVGQCFQVLTAATYPIATWYLKREGNITGSLIAKIYAADINKLPTGPALAQSSSVDVSQLTESFSPIVFTFTTPPSLVPSTNYVLVLTSDPFSTYASTQINNVATFDNSTAQYPYTYTALTGVVQYLIPLPVPSTSPLASVKVGNYIKDSSGTYFKVLSVNTALNTVTIASGATFSPDAGPTLSNGSGSIYTKDNVYFGYDSSILTYPYGNMELYSSGTWAVASPTAVAIFSVAGPKSVTVKSNLTPTLGSGATISSRYYDDNKEMSFILGTTGGIITSASDVNALGKGTVALVANSKVDTFVFRTSPYADDMVNFRNNEIPQLNLSDLNIQLFGGT